jgi:hypothetical protein
MESFPVGSSFSMIANLASIELMQHGEQPDFELNNTKALYDKVKLSINIEGPDATHNLLSSDPNMIFAFGKAMSNLNLAPKEISNVDDLLRDIKFEFINKLENILKGETPQKIDEISSVADLCFALSQMTTELNMDMFTHPQDSAAV